MTTKIYTKADLTQWESAKKDILGSIEANLDAMFEKAHLLAIREDENDSSKRVFLDFDICDKNYVQTASIALPNRLFSILPKK